MSGVAGPSVAAAATATTKPRRTMIGRVVNVHKRIVNFFGWKVLIGTPLAFSAAWGSYYYVYHYRPWQLVKQRRQISDVRPHRKTKVYMTGGENGTDSPHGNGIVDEAVASHSKIPHLDDPRKEVGFVDESRWGRTKWKLAVVLRGVKVLLYASPVFTLLILAYFGVYEFQKACDQLHDLLCDLGPAFIKLGQWMATRPDLFPKEICDTLAKLYDTAPSHSWEATLKILADTRVHAPHDSAMIAANLDTHTSNTQMQDQLAETVGGRTRSTLDGREDDGTISILEALTDINEVPINSGSVAQVYHARLSRDFSGLKKGDEVALKVLHPGVRESIWKDVCVLRFGCEFIHNFVPGGKYFDPLVHWYEFSSFLVSQLNLDREADNLEQFRYNYRDFPLVEFPVPVRPLSSPDVLVESFERGYPMKKAPKVNSTLADLGVYVFLKMLFQDNFVHADLHPGNIFLRKRNRDDSIDPVQYDEKGNMIPDSLTLNEIVILDPGLVTSLSPKDRENFILLFSSVACGDSNLAAELMVERSPSQRCDDMVAFKADMAKVFAIVSPDSEQNKELEKEHNGQKAFRLSEVKIGDVLMGCLLNLRKHKVAIDGNFATLMMSVICGEGMGRAMNPDYNIFAAAAPYLIMSLKGSELTQLVTQLQARYGIGVVLDVIPLPHMGS